MVREAKLLNPGAILTEASLHWAKTTTIGLDTEFVRERTFFPKPGLIQVCGDHRVWLIDAVVDNPFTELSQMLDRADTVKVLHSVGEDLEIFRIVAGTLPQPLFDTQIAAAMLGFPLQIRYENLIEHCFGIDLPGGKARSNWCARPLVPELLEYAAQDVVWLPRLHDYLSEALQARQRLQWLQEDCQRIVDLARAEPDAVQPLARVKGAGRLEDKALAWLLPLVGWRDEQARQRDVPRSFVARDEALLETAARLVPSGPIESALTALPAGLRRRHGQRLLQWLEVNGPAENFQRPAELNSPSQEQRAWLKQAQQHVREQAQRLEIDPALIASKRELARLARGEQPDWMGGWRAELMQGLPEP